MRISCATIIAACSCFGPGYSVPRAPEQLWSHRKLQNSIEGIKFGHGFVTPTVVVESAAAAVAGHTTYRLVAELGPLVANLYVLFGDESHPASFPPAYQVEHPFGVDIGGAHRQLLALRPEASADSWLSVGPTDGDLNSEVGSIGVPFAEWSASHDLSFDDGAVFWTDPRDAGHHAELAAVEGSSSGGPGGSTFSRGRSITLAQLTRPTGSGFTARLSVQGYLHNRNTVVGSTDGSPVHNSWAEELTFSVPPAGTTTEPAVGEEEAAGLADMTAATGSTSSLCSEHQLALLRHCAGAARCRRCNKRRLLNFLEDCGLADGTAAVSAAGCHAQHHSLPTPTAEYILSQDDELQRLLAWVEASEH